MSSSRRISDILLFFCCWKKNIFKLPIFDDYKLAQLSIYYTVLLMYILYFNSCKYILEKSKALGQFNRVQTSSNYNIVLTSGD